MRWRVRGSRSAPNATRSNGAASSLTVQVEAAGQPAHDETFIVDGESKLIKDGGSVGLKDINEGDKVTITFRQKDGKNVVVNLGVEKT